MSDAAPVRLRFDTFELDEANARLTRAGAPVALSPKAFALLCALARQPGRLVGKNALLDAVWGHRHVSESVLKTVVSQLRAALGDDAKQPRYLETVSRLGYRFIGLAAPDAAVPAPARAGNTTPMIGRADALARLRAAYTRAAGGEPQLVWIAGDAGVGKSTLLEAFAAELEPGVAVLGRCIEHFGSGEPHLPLLEILKELCRRTPELAATLRAVAPMWLVQMPWLAADADRAALQREIAGAHPDRMLRELGELLERYTVTRPLVLMLEDVHWSDLGTLRVMEDFARRARPLRLLWIATFRLSQVIAESHPLRDLRQELRLHHLCNEILLDPFSEQEVGAYLGSRLPDATVGEDFVRRLHAHTGGLPLFVASVTDSLLAQGISRATASANAAPPTRQAISSSPELKRNWCPEARCSRRPMIRP
jgi:DNA-binding winged helix-turn-helix (wHTH) protein